MKIPSRSVRIACLGAGVHALAAAGFAAQPAPTARPATGDDVIKLEEFSVAAGQTFGYRATNSITATGIGTKISDIPIPITVVTGELIEDVRADSLAEALTYVPGVGTSPRNESTFLVRGFSGLISYRNGQYRRQLFTSNNVERVEVAKGAAGIFFGTVRPGGVINYITAKPKFDAISTELKTTLGQDDYYRFEVAYNRPLTKQLAARAFVSVLDAGGDQQFEFRRDYYADVALAWKPRANQTLLLEVEGMNRSRFYLSSYGSRAISNSRYLFNSAVPAANQTTTAAATATRNWLNSQGYSATPGAPNFVPTFDMFAPIYGPSDPLGRTVSLTSDARQTQKSRSIDLDYLLKLSDSLVFQSNLNYAYDNTTGIQPGSGDTNPYADGTLRFQTEHFINIRHSYNADNKLTWRFDAVEGKHTWQFGEEFQKVIFLRPGYFDSASRYNNSPLGAFVTNYRAGVNAPVSTVAGMNASGQDFNIRRWTDERQVSFFFAGQSNFFRERLHVLYGVRYNRFSQRTTYNRPVSNTSRAGVLLDKDYGNSEPGYTPQFAVLYKITPEVSVFVDGSRAVEPNYAVDADGVPSQPIESKSSDIGIKTELFAGRLVSTLTYYSLERGNLAYNDVAKQASTGRSPYFIFGNTEASKGFEGEINWSVIDGYQLIVAYNHFTEAKVSKSNDPTRVGTPLNYNPDTSYTLWNRYEFRTGDLKGLAIGAGLRHSNAARLTGDPQNVVMMPAFTTGDLMASYNFKAFDRKFRAQVNVKNFTNKLYRDGTDGYFADRRNVQFTLSTKF
ncbi:TonB-dependent siderophore receptor [Horticoccus sp. 23ND18S-11]|uniref:TonB-dependent siderophore receptor n=1 Tax=Horticoccus sp. 23ND18S-11 TaxID=3391832 RepID=UPI0039C993FB